MKFPVITGRTTAGIEITQQAILRFVAQKGRHDSRISVKFGTASPTGRTSDASQDIVGPYNGISPNINLATPNWSV